MKLLTALAVLLAASAATAHASPDPEPEFERRAVVPRANAAPNAFGVRARLSAVVARGWKPFRVCRGVEGEPEGEYFTIPANNKRARTRGLLVDAVATGTTASDTANASDPALSLWVAPADQALPPVFADASEPADDSASLPPGLSCDRSPRACAALKAVPAITGGYVPPQSRAFALVPASGTCVTGKARVRTAAPYCRKGSDWYFVPLARGAVGDGEGRGQGRQPLKRVVSRTARAPRDAQAICESAGGDFADIPAADKAEISRVARRCVGAGEHVLAKSWNGDDYRGMGVELISPADPDADIHVGEPPQSGRWPIVCKSRTQLRSYPEAPTPNLVIVPAPKDDNGAYLPVTRDEARDLCAAKVEQGVLADLQAGGDWDYVLGEMLDVLGGPRAAAWVASWHRDTYDGACLALRVDANELAAGQAAGEQGRGGAIVVEDCAATKLNGAVCSRGGGGRAPDAVEEEADEEEELAEAEHEDDEEERQQGARNERRAVVPGTDVTVEPVTAKAVDPDAFYANDIGRVGSPYTRALGKPEAAHTPAPQPAETHKVRRSEL